MVNPSAEALDNAIREPGPGDVFVVHARPAGREYCDPLACADAIRCGRCDVQSDDLTIRWQRQRAADVYLLGAMAQFERDVMIERTKAGMAATVRRGTKPDARR